MKKSISVLFTVLFLLFLPACADKFEVNNAEEIVLKSRDADIEVRLAPSDADFSRIIDICEGKTYRGIPGCPFGISEIQFIMPDETVCIYPVGDDCCVFAVGDIGNEELTLVSVPEDGMKELKSIMNSYGIATEGA